MISTKTKIDNDYYVGAVSFDWDNVANVTVSVLLSGYVEFCQAESIKHADNVKLECGKALYPCHEYYIA